MDPRHRQPAPVPRSNNANSNSNSISNAGSNGASPFPPASIVVPPPLHSAHRHPFATHTFAPVSAYASDPRRASDTPYYPPAGRASLPAPELGHNHSQSQSHSHSRAQSTSSLPSLPSAREHSRVMPPPPTSPSQGQPPPPHHHHHQQSQSSVSYGPMPTRPPSLSAGPSTSFPSGRELPALSSLTRPGGGAGSSSMSISSMLGGPPPASRDSQPPPHYSSHGPPPSSGPGYGPAMQASPRLPSASSEYPPFRRPQTPDHPRPYDPRGSAAPSPHGPFATTPDLQRYNTPQGYHQRHPSAPADTSREPGRMSAGPPPTQNKPPPPYGGMPPRPLEVGRSDDPYARRDDSRPPPAMEYNSERPGLRPYPYDERFHPDRDRQPVPEAREREGRERAYSGGADSRRQQQQHMSPHELGHRDTHPGQSAYGRPPEHRDTRDQWGRPTTSDPNYRPPLEHQRPQHSEYPPASGPYSHHGQPYQASPPDRYPPTSHPPHPSGNAPAPPPQSYEADRARMDQIHPHPPQPQGPPRREEPPPPAPAGYGTSHGPSFDSPRKESDDHHGPNGLQRNLLAVQDINRKGRMSPLPQAVQGAQPQQPGPAAEPGIKSEFGRMFSGIGSGVSGIGMSSPVASSAATAFPSQTSHPAGAKREDIESVGVDSVVDNIKGAKPGRRRKLKDEDARDDDSSGRLTPAGRANKHSVPSPTTAAAQFKNLKGSTPTASPTEKSHHHHHHHHGQKTGAPAPASQTKPAPPVIPPKTKTVVASKLVLDSVANRARHHLGDFIYEPELKPGRLLPNTPTHRGFSSNPKPLPWDIIKDKENCILTVKVPLIHLSPVAREEITARAYLWGTDVYTDDSDVVAACIHGGWIKGEWTDDVDTAMLDLEQGTAEGGKRKTKIPTPELPSRESEGAITAPPPLGPMDIPANRDLHVNVLILPRLVKYSGSTRFGISSREFGGQYGSRHSVHDGISYMIKSIRWVENGAQPQARLRGKARRERMRKAMKEVTASFGNIHGLDVEQSKESNASPQRGDIIGNWRKKDQPDAPAEAVNDKPDQERAASEGNKENRVVTTQPGNSEEPAKETKKTPDQDVEMTEADAGKKESDTVQEK
ncbi:hypothetical protein VCV18_002744 [Metarhizium anisopliae]